MSKISIGQEDGTYGLESCHLALTGGNVVNDESTLCLAGVLVVEEIPVASQKVSHNTQHQIRC